MRRLASLLLALALPAVGLACSCAPEPVEEQVAAADAVFEALVLGTVDRGQAPSGDRPGRDARYWLRVKRTWKGSPPARLVLDTPRSGTSCDLKLRTLWRFVIFARRRGGRGWSTEACSGTQKVNRWILRDLDALGPVRAFQPERGPRRELKGAAPRGRGSQGGK